MVVTAQVPICDSGKKKRGFGKLGPLGRNYPPFPLGKNEGGCEGLVHPGFEGGLGGKKIRFNKKKKGLTCFKCTRGHGKSTRGRKR